MSIFSFLFTDHGKKRTSRSSRISNSTRRTSAKKKTEVNSSIIRKERKATENIKTPNATITHVSKSIEHKRNYGIYCCDKCSKEYVRHKIFLLHVSKCNGNIKHQCSICQKFLATSASLQRHSTSHLVFKGKLSCDLCPKQYSSKYSLNCHKRKQHSLNINKTYTFF